MSGITWQTFHATGFSGFEDAAELWARYIRDSVGTERVLCSAVEALSDDSGGLAADAVRAHLRRVSDMFVRDLTDYAERIKQLLYAAGEDFEARRNDLLDLFAEAGTRLVPTGGMGEERFEVSAPSPSDRGTAAERREERLRQVERAEALTVEFRRLMAEVRRIDDDLAAELRGLDDHAPELPPAIGAPGYEEKTAEYLRELHRDVLDGIGSGEAAPEEVDEWWASLSEADRGVFVHGLPELVGPVDGVPVADRDEANRLLLDRAIRELDERIRGLEAQAEETPGEPGADPSRSTTAVEIAALRKRHGRLGGLLDRIGEHCRIEGGPDLPYYLIALDSSGDGRAVVSVGNPDTADNVNVCVPGAGADLGGIARELDRAETLAGGAYAVAPDSTTASMVWLGAAASAADSAGDLSTFVDGLRTTARRAPANLTMIGHSHGATAIWVAARDEGLDVDDMIFVGAPSFVGSVEELGVGADHVWLGLGDGAVAPWTRAGSSGGRGDTAHGIDGNSDRFDGEEAPGGPIRDGVNAERGSHREESSEEGRTTMARVVTGSTEST